MESPQPRTPTILGWAGFDGGYRRAISFAQNKVALLEDEDQTPSPPPPPACPPPDDATYMLTVADVSICSCIPDNFGGSFNFDFPPAVNGVFPIAWSGGIGFYTITSGAPFHVYSDPACATPIANFDGDLVFEVQCSAGVVTVSIYVTNLFYPGGFIILFSGTGTMGNPMDNFYMACAGVGVSGSGGTALFEM